ncbi:WD40 repeat-like protein [Aulographum hederae CBS 113979]|uniref:WD40 repeat-like protein n=1 Tax=Aulographum hederae CBS 113979 TaxID=1176131 RepID=A0A6G1HF19_9PEZI|nr:WD40 repeat-like protein [Aulographum hederae CBS 113979]
MPTATAGMPAEKASAILNEFSRRRFADSIAVPTGDEKVRRELRRLGEPITLFAEGPGDRRDRLREIYTQRAEAGGEGEDEDLEMAEGATSGEDEPEEEFYTEGSQELLKARQAITRYSLPRAAQRIQRQEYESTIPLSAHVAHRSAIKDKLSGFELYGSQVAGDRPISITRFSPSGELLAAGNWGGGIRLISIPTLEAKYDLKSHAGRVGGVSWFPGATLPESGVTTSNVNFASGGSEGNVHLWNLEEDSLKESKPMAIFSGHTERVCRVEFHSSGKYLASAGADTTWRLWDVTTGTELVAQEGHSRPVYAVAFNIDGSLISSGGEDSIGRIWDIRSGRMVMLLDSHSAPINAVDWGTDGYRVLTGSSDCSVKCWDLRAVRESTSIGAHTGGAVTDLRWYKGADADVIGVSRDVKMEDADESNDAENDDEETYSDDRPLRKSSTFFVSSGTDRKVKIFSADDWVSCTTLEGHAGNVLSVDASRDGRWIASGGYDRSVKLWSRDDGAAI